MSEESTICGGCAGTPEFAKKLFPWERNRWTKEEWAIDYPQPRVCGGCGGMHPEDVIQMLRDGFADEPTDKRYKSYMHAPGYRAELIAYHKAIDKAVMKAKPDAKCVHEALEGSGDSILGKIHCPSDPVKGPLMKFYMWHFSPDQVKELISRSDEIRKNMPAPWERK